MCIRDRYRHIVRIANGQLPGAVPQTIKFPSSMLSPPDAHRRLRRRWLSEYVGFLTIAALHQGNYATIANYLERQLRYRDAGERGPKAPSLGHKGRRVTNSHVIHYDFGHRHALAALDGADLRRPRHAGAGRRRGRRRP